MKTLVIAKALMLFSCCLNGLICVQNEEMDKKVRSQFQSRPVCSRCKDPTFQRNSSGLESTAPILSGTRLYFSSSTMKERI